MSIALVIRCFTTGYYIQSSLFTSPSTERIIRLTGMLREACSLAFNAIWNSPPQQGTSMITTVSVLILASSIILRSLST